MESVEPILPPEISELACSDLSNLNCPPDIEVVVLGTEVKPIKEEVQRKIKNPSTKKSKRPREHPRLTFDDYYAQLMLYGETHDDYNVPRDHTVAWDDGTVCTLGTWLQKQMKHLSQMGEPNYSKFMSLIESGRLWFPSDDKKQQQTEQVHVVTPPVVHEGEESAMKIVEKDKKSSDASKPSEESLQPVLQRNDASENLLMLASVCSNMDHLDAVVEEKCSMLNHKEGNKTKSGCGGVELPPAQEHCAKKQRIENCGDPGVHVVSDVDSDVGYWSVSRAESVSSIEEVRELKPAPPLPLQAPSWLYSRQAAVITLEGEVSLNKPELKRVTCNA